MAAEGGSSSGEAFILTDEHFTEGVAEWTNEDDDDAHDGIMPGKEGEEGEEKKMDVGFSGDPSTHSRPDFWKVTDLAFDLTADFDVKVLRGFVDLSVEAVGSGDENLILDTRDLVIESAALIRGKAETPVPFILGKNADFRGSRLEIVLPPTKTDCKLVVRVHYSTSPHSSGLVWLRPEQTTSRTLPYLYSHSEAIHSRSIFPCQDTPAVKSTYSAKITVPSGLTVLMSAIGKGKEAEDAGNVAFRFEQSVPIPSYLVAIAIGNLESRKIGPRSHVWSEPELVDKAAYEFAETEEMLAAAESMVGSYVWGIYDILVLPPSFPFGGMENPCLTFLTPTLLAGDRSLANVVAHEIAHSWTGNLVTNRNWEHFWLNEGFTTFLERKIKGKMMGEEHRQFSAIEGLESLTDEVNRRGLSDPLTKLVPDLSGLDPDDAFGSVPYEKGHSLLFYLEQLVGGAEKFNPCLKAWIDKYKYQTADSQDFKGFFEEYFHKSVDAKVLASIDWKAWFDSPGMPPVELKYDDTLTKACTALKDKWCSTSDKDCSCFTGKDVVDFSAAQKINFLAQLLHEEPFCVEKLHAIDRAYDFSGSLNAEIKFRWLRLCIRGKWEDMIPQAVAFAVEYQRMKFCRPIFRDLYAWNRSKDLAVEAYKLHKDTMAYVTATQLAKDLNLA
ncbi:Leukotriene A-4 hydrolase [Hypsibius exemplaris]|uniref:Leukotriene A-4 hydrolase n=1 Tax=Hypsibius exemplaris TaxID=2072580 RepID=A0A1W0WNP9_HYPEX|nr:Leukotriene A-4 hydrolase [Hypsibius exemplaris]